jgi:SAM-dependent methyltransferase
MSDTVYNKDFYEDQQNGSLISAKEIWPVIFQYVRPKSVIDIGCGVGTWLAALNDFQITDYNGVDGDYVQPDNLFISKEKFLPHDLTRPFKASRKYDLAMSLEVGEHLPDTSADDLVRTLTSAADFVLFSAALPGQTGTYHINEQWHEYWAKKFIAQGFVAIDCIRKPIWNNTRIPVWYRQNMLLYIKRELLDNPEYSSLKILAEKTDPEFLTRIHPELFNYCSQKVAKLSTFEGFARYKLAPLVGK